ncbi:MAG: helix-turn-helix transcriptional regulator [Sulfuricella sp.]|nr:helix-turn-helix transcriptional regulator [Sulfuricella sp.]
MSALTVHNRAPVWTLRQRMKDCGIRTATDLHNRLKNVDPNAVGFAQFARIIDQPPARLNLRTLVGLTIVLDCKVADLLDVGPDLTRKGVNHHV